MAKSKNEYILDQIRQRLYRNLIPKVLEQSADNVGQVIVDDIKANLKRGVSPVEGEGRFDGYSKSYLKQIDQANFLGQLQKKGKKKYGGELASLLSKIDTTVPANIEYLRSNNKKKRPVNLRVSGKMIDSLRYIVSAFADKGQIVIEYTDKLAYIHTVLGAGKSKVIRKALPQGNETLSRTILRKVNTILGASIKDAVANIMKEIKY